MTLDRNVKVRFIEYMPSKPNTWRRELFMPTNEIMERVSRMGKLAPKDKKSWGGPARVFKLEGAIRDIGFVSPVTTHVCDNYNRLRLTSGGEPINCLFNTEKMDSMPYLVNGASDEDIAFAISARIRLGPKAKGRKKSGT